MNAPDRRPLQTLQTPKSEFEVERLCRDPLTPVQLAEIGARVVYAASSTTHFPDVLRNCWNEFASKLRVLRNFIARMAADDDAWKPARDRFQRLFATMRSAELALDGGDQRTLRNLSESFERLAMEWTRENTRPPTEEHKTFRVKELRDTLDLGKDRFRHYVDAAELPKTRPGDRERRFSLQDAIAICTAIASNKGARRSTRERANSLLERLLDVETRR